MNEQRRLVLFFTLSMALVFASMTLFPPPKPNQQKPGDGPLAEAVIKIPAEGSGDAEPLDAMTSDHPAEETPPAASEEKPAKPEWPVHPEREVLLGSADPDSGFFLNVKLSSRGAAVESIDFNDPRYPRVGQRGTPLTVVGSNPMTSLRTFGTRLVDFDGPLPDGNLAKATWEVLPSNTPDEEVAFRIVTPDGKLQITKTYSLERLPVEQARQQSVRDDDWRGYRLKLKVELRNLSSGVRSCAYQLQGPVGVPLEDSVNSSKFRDVRMGFLLPKGEVESRQLSATKVFEKEKERNQEIWTRPVKYLGVDVRFFAALVEVLGDQVQSPTVSKTQAVLVSAPLDEKEKQFSDVSVQFDSIDYRLAAAGKDGDRASAEFSLLTCPKRDALLSPLSASSIIFYDSNSGTGVLTFTFLWKLMLGEQVCRLLVWLLHSFHAWGAPYGIAIMLLTVVVRTAMFPLSKRQAASSHIMKQMQPKMKELQKKYKDNKEQLSRAQMELYREHNFNPAAGCLPGMVQIPIFVALYTAISVSVDLRMAKFLWIDNLASPDALFNFGFKVPFLGWEQFNLLPFLTIGLFVAQQKLTMPPPADEEQAMQYRMMNFMMIFMGVMFYRVPAALCIYFIASSIWGLGERWLIERLHLADAPGEAPATTAALATAGAAPTTGSASPAKPDTPEKSSLIGSMWQKLQEAADKESSYTRPESERPPTTDADRDANKRNKKRRR